MIHRTLLQSSRLLSATSIRSLQTPLTRLSLPQSSSSTSSIFITSGIPRRLLSTDTKPENLTAEETKPNGKWGEGGKSNNDLAEKEASQNGGVPDEITKLRAELEAKAKEAAEFKDRYLRSVADFHNLQGRTVRDVKAARDFAIQSFAKDLVETVDNIDRALNTVPEETQKDPSKNKELHDLFQGVKMTENILLSTLEKHGLKRTNPLGEKFDPNLHEATFQTRIEDKEPGIVFFVQRTGYTLNGRTLRAAQVGVVEAPPPPQDAKVESSIDKDQSSAQ